MLYVLDFTILVLSYYKIKENIYDLCLLSKFAFVCSNQIQCLKIK